MACVKKKLLIADSCFQVSPKEQDQYEIAMALTGKECLEKLESFKPDLLVVDFMLPEMHGIEILKRAKNHQSIQKMGVILTGYHPMIQNYQSALKLGALYFLEKPYTERTLFQLVDLFFEGTLTPAPFIKKKVESKFNPSPSPHSQIPSYLKLWGTRGSNPVAGSEYVRFGGNTPSLEIRNGDDLVIIDAGSGIRGLGHILNDHPNKKIDILLSHTHWDHLLGFPFFYPIYQENREIHIWSPVGFEKSSKELFSDMLAYAYFPVRLDDIQASLFFHDLRDGQTETFGSIKISSHYAFHPGPTLCFKIEMKGKKIGYVTDNEFLMGCHLPSQEMEKAFIEPYKSQIDFLSDCDILIHEAQYTDQEYAEKEGWGHSSITNASFLLKQTGVKKWIITHHDPRHTDEYLLQKHQTHLTVMQEIGHECIIQFGYDGMMIAID